ncbi:Peptidase C48, SUMO/Sentrin/Ubl1 [Artemisia annua]|uniref:Peptidase C48, SUMO/Sentrin/Ubl1 n=1 Tax=Artemisia annua TaxID=35608 RepID=A0A2U1MZQ0_ARTAN|nr:Peptidase C48, SUMO/Sentrin/Ubl1 [Artemisia annua]
MNCITKDICHGGLTWEQQCEIFDAQIAFSFSNNTRGSNLKNIDLVFFPILVVEYFYVVVFNLKKTAINILNNNRDEATSYAADYKDICDLLITLFSRYLEGVGHKKRHVVTTAVPYIPKFKCTTKKNIQDFGIFSIHHMEMYMGEPFSKWDYGLVEKLEKQNLLLLRLRVKFADKILLHEINVLARKVMLDFEEFHKYLTVSRKEII